MNAVAAVDIGTNSVRLLVTDARGQELVRAMKMTRLGEGVDESGVLGRAALARTLAVLGEYAGTIRQYGAARVRAVATSAVRDAHNQQTFFDEAERALGVRPELLSGDEEARLSFRGATEQLDASAGPFLVIDIGGGSTEFVLGTTAPEALISIDLGCVRMTERHLKSDPPAQHELDAAFADVRRALVPVRAAIDVSRARCGVGLAGTVTSTAAFALGLTHYDRTKTHHSRLTRDQVEHALARLAKTNAEGRRVLLVQPERAEVIVGGLVVLAGILRELAIGSLIVSESDILDGLAASIR